MKNIKYLFSAFMLVALVFSLSTNSFAQDDKKSRPSPPAKASKKIGDTEITVDYSSPSVKNRKIWGELVPYDKVWRTGANEPTKITFSKDVMVEGKELKAGTYALFTIPGENEWTVIFNNNHEQWGATQYSEDEDALRITAKPKKSKAMAEQMKIDVKEKGPNKAEISLAWENLEVPFTVEAKKGDKKGSSKSK